MPEKELHVISNGKLSWPSLAAIAAEIHPYVTSIHIREKTKSPDEVFLGVQHVIEQGIPLEKIVINSFPEVAAALQTGGVQLTGASNFRALQREHRDKGHSRVGASVHHTDEAKWREEEGVDYLIFGHVFETNSKQGVSPRGLDVLREVVNHVNIPVIAIGGMTPARVKSVVEAGAAGIAVMSGIWDAADPLGAVRAYQQELQRMEVSG
ncbi:thiamine phosphate synthase [Paenibacillus roseipurpureus]|uniref:Thiamine phosphate synthase n=1 Tax=Paenibacillus roseopurpureus TaxID=2918901 RepID=A0AA96LN12_9BACL|nr:thiamine phosphate synthase [Paenibacillus sp. MBLB1832]WNR44009.1 thiamine phosphate synthase [Paenibacillus sp. MBLB1832]